MHRRSIKNDLEVREISGIMDVKGKFTVKKGLSVKNKVVTDKTPAEINIANQETVKEQEVNEIGEI